MFNFCICVGLGEVLLTKEASPVDGDALLPGEKKGRQGGPLVGPPEFKRVKAEGPKVDPAALTLETAGNLRVEGEEESNFPTAPRSV